MFLFSTCSPVFCYLSTKGPNAFLRFLYILGNPCLLCGMAGNQIYSNDLILVSFGSAIFFYSSWCQKWWRSHKFTFFSSVLFLKSLFSGGVSYQNVHLYILWTLNRVKAWGVGNWGAHHENWKVNILLQNYYLVLFSQKSYSKWSFTEKISKFCI